MTDKELIGKLDAMVKALQKAKKKTDKTNILLDARKDFGEEADELMAFFRFLLDPSIVTGLSDAKINKKVTVRPDIDVQYLSCGYLYIMGASHNTGSDASIATIQNYLHKNPEYEEFLKRLFTKNLPIGVEAATINKVYGEEIIPVWEVQQGYPIGKVKLKDGIWFSLSQKLNGCFTWDTSILMADGSEKHIVDIQPGDVVQTFDESTRELSTAKVLNKFENGLKPLSEWVRISCDTNCGGTKYRYTAKMTKNHKVFTPSGWIEAGNLQVGDTIYTKDYELSDTQISVLLGIGLGDANVVKDYKYSSITRYVYIKKAADEKYLFNTMSVFDGFIGVTTRKTSGFGKPVTRVNLKTFHNLPSYLSSNKNILRTGYTFTEDIINHLTPLALALFYIDDGCRESCKKDGYERSVNVQPRAQLALHRHPKESAERLSKYLNEKYGITNRIVKYDDHYKDCGYQLEMDVNGTIKFYDLIAKYIPPEMRPSKLSHDWLDVPYEDWTKDFGEYKLVKKTIGKIEQMNEVWKRPARKSLRSYDLEVDGTHTYFANRIAVHNCRGTMYKGELISRQAQKFKGLDHIKNDLLALYDGDASRRDAWVFDGELIYKNPERMSDGEAFRYGTGLLNSDNKDKTGIKFVIFDVIPVVEFDRGKCTIPYKIRRIGLNCLRAEITRKHLENIEIVPMVYEGKDQNVIPKWLDYAVEHDWEGLMLNTDVPYRRARHNGCLKIKRFYTVDLRIIAIEEGQNRLAGTMGALVVDYKGNEIRVGSGFDDATRAAVWANPDNYIGKIVECKYKEVTMDKKTGLESLQFPTFVRFRDDKNEVSYG